MLDLFAKHRDELGVTAPIEAPREDGAPRASQLSERTATVTVAI
jgi:hypothetical protein